MPVMTAAIDGLIRKGEGKRSKEKLTMGMERRIYFLTNFFILFLKIDNG
jgi:hypothetical protein